MVLESTGKNICTSQDDFWREYLIFEHWLVSYEGQESSHMMYHFFYYISCIKSRFLALVFSCCNSIDKQKFCYGKWYLIILKLVLRIMTFARWTSTRAPTITLLMLFTVHWLIIICEGLVVHWREVEVKVVAGWDVCHGRRWRCLNPDGAVVLVTAQTDG